MYATGSKFQLTLFYIFYSSTQSFPPVSFPNFDVWSKRFNCVSHHTIVCKSVTYKWVGGRHFRYSSAARQQVPSQRVGIFSGWWNYVILTDWNPPSLGHTNCVLPRRPVIDFPQKLVNSRGYQRYCSLISLRCQKANYHIEVHSKLCPSPGKFILFRKVLLNSSH